MEKDLTLSEKIKQYLEAGGTITVYDVPEQNVDIHRVYPKGKSMSLGRSNGCYATCRGLVFKY